MQNILLQELADISEWFFSIEKWWTDCSKIDKHVTPQSYTADSLSQV